MGIWLSKVGFNNTQHIPLPKGRVYGGFYLINELHPERGFQELLKSGETVFILFYSPRCPFSQRFLPVFEKFFKEKHKTQFCARVVVEDNNDLCEKYSIDVVPTVLVFEKGDVIRRLDGEWGVGLNEKKLKSLFKDLALS